MGMFNLAMMSRKELSRLDEEQGDTRELAAEREAERLWQARRGAFLLRHRGREQLCRDLNFWALLPDAVFRLVVEKL
jgi:hypothetical protein